MPSNIETWLFHSKLSRFERGIYLEKANNREDERPTIDTWLCDSNLSRLERSSYLKKAKNLEHKHSIILSELIFFLWNIKLIQIISNPKDYLDIIFNLSIDDLATLMSIINTLNDFNFFLDDFIKIYVFELVLKHKNLSKLNQFLLFFVNFNLLQITSSESFHRLLICQDLDQLELILGDKKYDASLVNGGETLYLNELFKKDVLNFNIPLLDYFSLGKISFLSNQIHNVPIYLSFYINHHKNNTEEHEKISHAFVIMGQCYYTNNQAHDALYCFDKAIEFNSINITAYQLKASIHFESAILFLKDNDLVSSHMCFNAAQHNIEEAISFEDNSPTLLLAMARWHVKHIELIKATPSGKIKTYQRIIADFEDAIHYFELATTHRSETDVALTNTIDDEYLQCQEHYENYKKQQKQDNNSIDELDKPIDSTPKQKINTTPSRTRFGQISKSLSSFFYTDSLSTRKSERTTEPASSSLRSHTSRPPT